MRANWLFCALFLPLALDVRCFNDEFVTIWAPKQVYEEKDYNVIILPTNIDKRTEVTLYFRRNYGTMAVHPSGNDKIYKAKIFNRDTGSRNFFDLTMILHRNETVGKNTRQLCMSDTLHKIEAEKKDFHIFIQTDKPIYKPGDDVRFRIIFVDRDLKPFHINNIHVNISDSHNRVIHEFTDPGKGYSGVFSEKFQISDNTALGIWNIQVVIDKKFHWKDTKTFAVQKIVLPPFDAYIFGSKTHLSTSGILNLSFYAKYSFGDFVKGNAQLVIKNRNSSEIVYTKEFRKLTEATKQEVKIQDDLNASTRTRLDYEATIIFTEPESAISANKSFKFSVIADMNDKVVANHPEKYGPGLPFGVKASVYDWKDKLIPNSHERVVIKYDLQMKNGLQEIFSTDVKIINGIATKNQVIPDDTVKFTLKIFFKNKLQIEKEIKMGSAIIGVNQITVTHEPEFPLYNEEVKIFVRADSELDSIISMTMTRHGNTEIHQRYCNYTMTCSFNITMKRDMMPKSKVVVYYVKDRQKIFQGETTIKTKELSGNYLDIGLPESVQPKETVNVKVTTRPESSVYLLAYDKRLTYLWTGNEVTSNDVIQNVAGADGYNEIKKFHINKENWQECSQEELKRIARGRVLLVEHSRDEFILQEDEDQIEPPAPPNDIPYVEPNILIEPAQSANDIRENFRDVFMYADFKTNSNQNVTTASYYVPDSITSWMVSAFSMNEKHGIAIAPTKEFSVKKNFFTKLAVPYSIRYKEKLRLDIIVHNYVDPKEDLTVTVTMFDDSKQNHLKFYSSLCDSTPSSNKEQFQTVTVPSFQVKRVSFYIQSNSENEKFEQIPKIAVNAVGLTKRGHKFEDKMRRKLKIEPVGVKFYEITSNSSRLNSKQDPKQIVLRESNTDGYPKFRVAISGDYLSDTINIKSDFIFHPLDCLEQRTSKLKGNVEYLRYMRQKNINPPVSGFSDSYQSIIEQRRRKWNYKNTAGFRAYFLEAIASAMELKAIPVNSVVIESELDALKNYQEANGSFRNFGNMPSYSGNTESRQTFETAYVLIPFLKFQKMVKKRYDDVIDAGFNFLQASTLKSDENALSVAAIAYGLHGQVAEAGKLLNKVEELKLTIDGLTCYKTMRNLTSCDLRHTSYTILAYLNINKRENAKESVTWLLKQHRVNQYFSNTQDHAIATEAIANYFSKTKSYATDFKVILENDGGFNKTVHITKANVMNTHEIEFPDYSLFAKIKYFGAGYCSITTIVEKTTSLERTESKFTLDVKANLSLNVTNEAFVKVCATYHSNLAEDGGSQTLFNVIYDVEFPSGYIYSEIVDEARKTEIKYVKIRNARTRIQIYYNDYNVATNYCVDIKVKRAFDVSVMQNAGVQVYDFMDKQNMAIEFYKFSSECT